MLLGKHRGEGGGGGHICLLIASLVWVVQQGIVHVDMTGHHLQIHNNNIFWV